MRLSEIDTFFQELDRGIDFPIEVIVTGGAAAAIFGAARPTEDIDFEVHLKIPESKQPAAWEVLQRELQRVGKTTNITPQFAEDIDRWSSIAMPERKSKLWKKIGKIEVKVLAPELWAIGKLARYLSSDERDLVAVFSRIESDPHKLARLWGRALGISPASSVQSTFSRRVQGFFQKYAAKLWGKKAKPEELQEVFLKSAREKR